MRFKETMDEIAGNVKRVSEEVEEETINEFKEMILQARKVFTYGAGRSGFMARAFAQRMMHLGIDSCFVGDAVTPYFNETDLFVVASGSGGTASAVALAEKAKKIGGKVALVTSTPDSPIGRIADLIIDIKSKSKADFGERKELLAPYTSLFDITTLSLFDSVARVIMDEKGITEEDIDSRHATVE